MTTIETPAAIWCAALDVSIPLPHGTMPIVRDVSFDVPVGSTVALVGESGSGKTMTATALLGLTPSPLVATASSIRVAGTEVTTASRQQLRQLRGQRVGMIFQQPTRCLNPAYSVGDQIAETIRVHQGESRRASWQRAVQLLDRVGIADSSRRARSYPHEFSGGMCQRVMIAMSLACGPDVLIADEPTTALDVTVQARILDLIDELQAEMNLTVLLITHDLAVVANRCDRVIVMYSGEIVEDAPRRRFFDRATHPYSVGLLAASADTQPKSTLRTVPGTAPKIGVEIAGCRFADRCGAVIAACRAEPILLESVSTDHLCRCVRQAELVHETERHGVA